MQGAWCWCEADQPPTTISVKYERHARGLPALGHDPVSVALPAAARGYAEPLVAAPDRASLADLTFWRSLRPDAAIVITWLGLSDVVGSLKQAWPWVTSIADSDGKIGVRIHPGPTFSRMTAQHRHVVTGVRAAFEAVLASAVHADQVAVCSNCAAKHLRMFFFSYRRPNLAAKVRSVPYPIDECYLSDPVGTNRKNQVVAIERWDNPQKHARLLCHADEEFLESGARSELVVAGPHCARWFAPVVKGRPYNVVVPGTLAKTLRQSRALLLPSRWERGPIVLNEALVSGWAVVGTDAVPSMVSACAEAHSGPWPLAGRRRGWRPPFAPRSPSGTRGLATLRRSLCIGGRGSTQPPSAVSCSDSASTDASPWSFRARFPSPNAESNCCNHSDGEDRFGCDDMGD